MVEETKLILTLEDQEFLRGIKKTGKAIEKNTRAFEGLKGSVISFNAALQFGAKSLAIFAKSFEIVSSAIIETTKIASEFAESQSKLGVIFSDIGKSANLMRDDLVNAFGLSTNAATQLLSSTGDLLTGFGFQQRAALDLSGDVNKLAADLASFSNLQGGTARASEILTKALLGERDSLIALGVKVSEEDVKARLTRDGKDQLTGATLRQARAEATFSLITEQSANALGDFARTQSSFANQTRIAEASIEDLQLFLGQAFLPIMRSLTVQFVQTTKEVKEFIKSNQEVIQQGFADAILIIADGFIVLNQAVGFVINTFNLASGIFNTVFKGIAIGLKETVAGFRILANAIVDAFLSAGESITSFFKDITGDIGVLISLFDQELGDSISGFASTVTNSAAQIRKEFKDGFGATKFEEELSALAKGFADNAQDDLDNIAAIDSATASVTNKIIALKDQVRQLRNQPIVSPEDDQKEDKKQTDRVEDVDDNSEARIKAEKKVLDAKRKALEEFSQFSIDIARKNILSETTQRLQGLAEAVRLEAITLEEAEVVKNEIKLQAKIEGDELLAEQREAAFQKELEQSGVFNQALAEQFGITGDIIADVGKTIKGTLVDAFGQTQQAISSMFLAAFTGAKSTKEIFVDLGKSILKTMIDALVKIGLQFIVTSILGSQAAASQASSGLASAVSVAGAAAFRSAIEAVPFPANIIAAPLAATAAIAGASLAGSAGALAGKGVGTGIGVLHEGSDFIGRTGRTLVQRGERMFSTPQNEEILEILRDSRGNGGGRGTSVVIQVENFIGQESFVDEFASQISRSISDRNVDFRPTEEVGGF